MAYNQAGFNVTAFNVAGTGGARWLRAKYKENVTASLGAYGQVLSIPRGYERVAAEVSGMCIHYEVRAYAETVSTGGLTGGVIICPKAKFKEAVTQAAEVKSVITPDASLSEAVTAKASVDSTIYPAAAFSEAVTGELEGGLDIYLESEGYELIRSAVSAMASEIRICRLNVTLGPGERLIIDSDYYNVLLNGENAIYAQSGDWMDELNRGTVSLDITAATNQDCLAGTIRFTERYL